MSGLKIKVEIGKNIYDGVYIDGGIHSLSTEGVIIKRKFNKSVN